MQTLQGGRFYPIWLAGLLLALFASWAQAGGFKLTDTDGKTHTLDGYKGKWVLVNFWATWCPPCQEEIPDLIALHGEKKNNLVVIGIAMDYRNAKQVTDFADGLLVDYPIVLGNAQVASQIRLVFDGDETLGEASPTRLLVIAERADLGARVSTLRDLLDEVTPPDGVVRLLIEGLPPTAAATSTLLDELART